MHGSSSSFEPVKNSDEYLSGRVDIGSQPPISAVHVYDKPVLLVLECNETVAVVLIPDRFEVDSISTTYLLVPAVQLPGSCSDTFAVRALETGSGSDTNARVGSGTFLVNTKV